MKAPYRPGDQIRVLHSCVDAHGGGTALAVMTVEACKALAANGRWRVRTTRCDGSQLEAEVNVSGRDVHGYVEPVKGGAS